MGAVAGGRKVLRGLAVLALLGASATTAACSSGGGSLAVGAHASSASPSSCADAAAACMPSTSASATSAASSPAGEAAPSGSSSGAALPPGVDPATLAISVGKASAPGVLDVYEDLRCPYCDEFEKTLGADITSMVNAGRVRVNYHLATFLDANLGGSGSKNAANAAGCAQAAGKFPEYHAVLYANQPDETEDGFADSGLLITLAKTVPGLDAPDFESCVRGLRYAGWVTNLQPAFDAATVEGQPVTGTPTVVWNGKRIGVLSSSGGAIDVATFEAELT